MQMFEVDGWLVTSKFHIDINFGSLQRAGKIAVFMKFQ